MEHCVLLNDVLNLSVPEETRVVFMRAKYLEDTTMLQKHYWAIQVHQGQDVCGIISIKGTS